MLTGMLGCRQPAQIQKGRDQFNSLMQELNKSSNYENRVLKDGNLARRSGFHSNDWASNITNEHFGALLDEHYQPHNLGSAVATATIPASTPTKDFHGLNIEEPPNYEENPAGTFEDLKKNASKNFQQQEVRRSRSHDWNSTLTKDNLGANIDVPSYARLHQNMHPIQQRKKDYKYVEAGFNKWKARQTSTVRKHQFKGRHLASSLSNEHLGANIDVLPVSSKIDAGRKARHQQVNTFQSSEYQACYQWPEQQFYSTQEDASESSTARNVAALSDTENIDGNISTSAQIQSARSNSSVSEMSHQHSLFATGRNNSGDQKGSLAKNNSNEGIQSAKKHKRGENTVGAPEQSKQLIRPRQKHTTPPDMYLLGCPTCRRGTATPSSKHLEKCLACKSSRVVHPVVASSGLWERLNDTSKRREHDTCCVCSRKQCKHCSAQATSEPPLINLRRKQKCDYLRKKESYSVPQPVVGDSFSRPKSYYQVISHPRMPLQSTLKDRSQSHASETFVWPNKSHS